MKKKREDQQIEETVIEVMREERERGREQRHTEGDKEGQRETKRETEIEREIKKETKTVPMDICLRVGAVSYRHLGTSCYHPCSPPSLQRRVNKRRKERKEVREKEKTRYCSLFSLRLFSLLFAFV